MKRCFTIELDSHQYLIAFEWRRGQVAKSLLTGKGCVNSRPNHTTYWLCDLGQVLTLL